MGSASVELWMLTPSTTASRALAVRASKCRLSDARLARVQDRITSSRAGLREAKAYSS